MASTHSDLEVDGRKIAVSNLDKVLYPSGFSKSDVINYYIRISPFLLPHLKNRPLTLKRYPNGVKSEYFYEKNAPSHTPKWVKTATVKRHGEKGGSIRFVLVDDLPTLIWSANLANLELHTPLAKVPKMESPTMIVFDLDPGPPANVLECAEVALQLKAMFDILKLESFVKVSGSKGMQMYIPLNTPSNYEFTRGFAKTIAEMLTERHPDLVLSNMSKELRKGKVFIDFSQNAVSKTTVCVYSLRAAHDEPFVSMPLTWKELESILKKGDAEDFFITPDNAVVRAEKSGDLFAPLLKIKQTVPSDFALKLSKKHAVIKGDTSLRAYRAKRDFKQTKEPAPADKKSKGKQKDLMFVIQKHQARQLHYDFRLEMEGVLRSWAVPKGLPTSRSDKRLAMHVEDHPMDYARFEGTIPTGNYGAGTVMVWDIGTYEVKEGDNPVVAYHKGKIPLLLHGKKLKGEWVLVKSRIQQGDKQGWLLLKTDKDIPAITARQDDSSALTKRSMARIAKDNDAQWQSNRPAH
ncbi:MAG TPA: non-homologous end-joining DNA ligase [Acidobacteriota bacterium]|nr:non-homologous end-joining DNA ligase [Acidobacteriota bacterium]